MSPRGTHGAAGAQRLPSRGKSASLSQRGAFGDRLPTVPAMGTSARLGDVPVTHVPSDPPGLHLFQAQARAHLEISRVAGQGLQTGQGRECCPGRVHGTLGGAKSHRPRRQQGVVVVGQGNSTRPAPEQGPRRHQVPRGRRRDGWSTRGTPVDQRGLRDPGRRRDGRPAHPGGAPVDPAGHSRAGPRRPRALVDPAQRTGKGAQGRASGATAALRTHVPPLGKGVRAAGPRRRPARAGQPRPNHRLTLSFPVPARGPPRGPGEAGEGRRGGRRQGAREERGAAGGAPPPRRSPSTRPPPPHSPPRGRDGRHPHRPAGGGARDPPARPTPARGGGGPERGGQEGTRGDGPARGRRASDGPGGGHEGHERAPPRPHPRLPPRQGRRDGGDAGTNPCVEG